MQVYFFDSGAAGLWVCCMMNPWALVRLTWLAIGKVLAHLAVSKNDLLHAFTTLRTPKVRLQAARTVSKSIIGALLAACPAEKRQNRLGPSGRFPTITSRAAIRSAVSASRASSAARLSLNCSSFDAPRMTVETLGLARHQSNAR